MKNIVLIIMAKWRSRLGKVSIIITFLVSALVFLFIAQPAHTETKKYVKYSDPPLLEPSNRSAPKDFDLTVKYINSEIHNPETNHNDKVYLRSYINPKKPGDNPHVGPTIDVKLDNTLGNLLRINLHNALPADPDCHEHPLADLNAPHCFNVTNLHGHGLWVSPKGNSDNVLESVLPNSRRTYEYKIPPNHPAGTFWYHPHQHGSTAIQVASGMAGALILRGNRLPVIENNQVKTPGDIDVLLDELGRDENEKPTDTYRERTLVLQQTPYACLENGTDGEQQVDWSCKDNTGVVNSYKQFGFDKDGNVWKRSGRHTSINGKILPVFESKVGDIERWRLIHAGVSETINLQFHKAKHQNLEDSIATLGGISEENYIKNNCDDTNRPDLHIISEDGLTRPYVLRTDTKILQPGYRSDALMVFPEAGDYCLIDGPLRAEDSPSTQDEPKRLLGVVHVTESTNIISDNFDVEKHLRDQLTDAAKRAIPVEPFQSPVIDDLKGDVTKGEMKLTAFVPHPTIEDDELGKDKDGKIKPQEVVYYIDSSDGNNTKFEISKYFYPNFDSHEYDPQEQRELTLGDAEEWRIASYAGSHPFHIHVNPFQIVKVLKDGRDVSALDSGDEQYAGLQGIWKDSIWIKNDYPDFPFLTKAQLRQGGADVEEQIKTHVYTA